MKPLAIIGTGPETHDAAPWEDETWERWGLGLDPYAARCHFLFEMHAVFEKPQHGRFRKGYIAYLRELDLPVYMQKSLVNCVPAAIEYPLDEVVEYLGRDYFGSTVAYMIGLAIRQHRRRVGIWGVDLSDDLHDHQRLNLAWLLGQAAGRGLQLEGPNIDTILALSDEVKNQGYPVRYGFVAEKPWVEAWGAA